MPQPLKKRKRTESSEDSKQQSELKQLIAKIKDLEQAIATSKTNLNNIVSLLDLTEHDHPKIIHGAIHALHRVFAPLLSKGDLQRPKKSPTPDDKKATVTVWLRDNYVRYLNRLCKLLQHDEPGLQLPALSILLDLLRIESAHLTLVSGSHHFANDQYARIVEAVLVNPKFSQPLQADFVDKYINVYDDLRYYFFKDAAKIITATLVKAKPKDLASPASKKKKSESTSISNPAVQAIPTSVLMDNTFSIIENIRTMPTDPKEIDEFWTGHPDPSYKKSPSNHDSDSDLDTPETKDKPATTKPLLLRLSVHRRALQDCWLAFLRLPLTEETYKRTLLILHKRVIPYMSQPPLLMDFLTDSYNAGGAISLLALNGLFTLITEHNLDYPDFYPKLYRLFDRNLMHVKYRSRFFRLVDLFLASTHLPATLVAAFIKRMSRLTLTSPPAGIVILIPMMYNLLKRHPTCMQLIHRPVGKASPGEDDPYDFDEPDPYKSNALASSLWEVTTLKEHYYSNVATLAKVFEEQFTKPGYDLEDFLDHTYATFFETEIARNQKMARKQKNPPALAFEPPKYLFPTATVTVTTNGDATAEEERDAAAADEAVERWAVWAF